MGLLVLEGGELVLLKFGHRAEVVEVTSNQGGTTEQVGVLAEIVGLGKLDRIQDVLLARLGLGG